MYIKSKFVKRTLQNKEIKHFFTKIFGHIKKKQYLCTVIKKT